MRSEPKALTPDEDAKSVDPPPEPDQLYFGWPCGVSAMTGFIKTEK